MSELFGRFSFQQAKLSPQIAACLLVIWLIVLFCALSSVFTQPFTRSQRIFWLAMILLLPVVGLLAYLPFSFRREDLPQLFLGKQSRQKQGRRRDDKLKRGRGA